LRINDPEKYPISEIKVQTLYEYRISKRPKLF